MASDLSKIIQDGLCDTLTNLLGKTAKLQETTKAHVKDLEDIELLKVDSTFEFENITSTWSFVLPAYSSSYIFNTMLGDTNEPSLKINDDIADAIGEFISNVSGGLTMAITPDSFEDLGGVKFTIAGNETVTADDIHNLDNLYKFTIDLEGTQIIIFILFDDIIMPFVEAISKSKISEYQEEVKVEINEDINLEEVENKETSENKSESKKEEVVDKKVPDSLSNDEDVVNEESPQAKEEMTPQAEKNKKIKKIIMAIGALLILTVIAGITMYFMGMFDPEPVIVEDKNTTKTIKTKDNVEVVKYKYKKKIDFKISQIDKNRLNARLQILTKNSVLTAKEIVAQKAEQDKRLEDLAKEKELIAFAKLNKEEPLVIKKKTIEKKITKKETAKKEIVKKETVKVETAKNKVVNKEINSSQKTEKTQKLNFVLVHSLKFKLYKDMILKTKTKQARISICKSQSGRTAVYIGPFEDESSQKHMIELMKEQSDINADLANITIEEFNTRCNFE